MSAEQLNAFLDAIKADPALQQQLMEAGDLDEVVAIAKAEGFVISKEEFTIQDEALASHAQAQLSDEELEGIGGGMTPLVAIGGATAVGVTAIVVTVPAIVTAGPIKIRNCDG